LRRNFGITLLCSSSSFGFDGLSRLPSSSHVNLRTHDEIRQETARSLSSVSRLCGVFDFAGFSKLQRLHPARYPTSEIPRPLDGSPAAEPLAGFGVPGLGIDNALALRFNYSLLVRP
jgi:hypothetical protein